MSRFYLYLMIFCEHLSHFFQRVLLWPVLIDPLQISRCQNWKSEIQNFSKYSLPFECIYLVHKTDQFFLVGSRTDNPVREPLNLGRICRYCGTDSLRTRKPTRQCKQSYRLWRLHCSKHNYKKAGWSQLGYSHYSLNGFIHWNMDFQSKENESFGDSDDNLYRWLLCYPYEAPYKTQGISTASAIARSATWRHVVHVSREDISTAGPLQKWRVWTGGRKFETSYRLRYLLKYLS